MVFSIPNLRFGNLKDKGWWGFSKELVASCGSTWTVTFSSYIVACARAGTSSLLMPNKKTKINVLKKVVWPKPHHFFRDAPASPLLTALHSGITFKYQMGLSHMCVGVHAYYAYLLSCFVNIGLEHIEAAITTLHTLFLISTFYQT